MISSRGCDTDSRRLELLEFLAGSNLEILNNWHEPTLVTSRIREVNDISLSSVTSNILSSDLRCSYFEMEIDLVKPFKFRNRKATNGNNYYIQLRTWTGSIRCYNILSISRDFVKNFVRDLTGQHTPL